MEAWPQWANRGQRLGLLCLAIPDGGAVAGVGEIEHHFALGEGTAGGGLGRGPPSAGLRAGVVGFATVQLEFRAVRLEVPGPVHHILRVIGEFAPLAVVQPLKDGDGTGFETPVAVVAGLVGFEVGIVLGQALHAGFVPAFDVLAQIRKMFCRIIAVSAIHDVATGIAVVPVIHIVSVWQCIAEQVFIEGIGLSGNVALG